MQFIISISIYTKHLSYNLNSCIIAAVFCVQQMLQIIFLQQKFPTGKFLVVILICFIRDCECERSCLLRFKKKAALKTKAAYRIIFCNTIQGKKYLPEFFQLILYQVLIKPNILVSINLKIFTSYIYVGINIGIFKIECK